MFLDKASMEVEKESISGQISVVLSMGKLTVEVHICYLNWYCQ
jgi:hypothetical protein